MSNGVPLVFKVPDTDQAAFRVSLNETVESQPDTKVACELFVLVYQGCTAVLHSDYVPLKASVVVESDSIAVLRVVDVPILTQVACESMRKIGHANTVNDIRCLFRHPETLQPLASGCIEIQFWRASVEPHKRRSNIHQPPQQLVELAAEPKWDDPALNLSDPSFETDRQRILAVMRLFRNMRDEMPTGIETSLDLVHAADFYRQSTQSSTSTNAEPTHNGSNLHKRSRNDDRADIKRRPGVVKKPSDATKSCHVGYCIIIEHPIALPTLNVAFMDYLKAQIGPTLLNWVVVFPRTKPMANSTAEVKHRSESLAIILQRSDASPLESTPYSISGVPWLVRRVETAID